MADKSFPFTPTALKEVVSRFGTPFHIYDEKGIRITARKLNGAFSWAPKFKEYFAVKALPNPTILSILKEEGLGVDCSSMSELLLAEMVGFKGEEIMFSSNNTQIEEFRKALEMGAIINFDDFEHIEFIKTNAGLPKVASCRYAPEAFGKGDTIMGETGSTKFGMTRKQLIKALLLLNKHGVERLGVHMMTRTKVLDVGFFLDNAKILFDIVREAEHAGLRIEFINLSGGIGIPYHTNENAFELDKYSKTLYELFHASEFKNMGIAMELGRYVTGPHGWLVTKVLHVKNSNKRFAGIDASMADLMRPGMYGAYHHISVIGKDKAEFAYDVVGSLCENTDTFAKDRMLPSLVPGDIIIIHDTGAHGHSMGFNYNGKLRAKELLLRENGTVEMIRRAETFSDYIATLKF
ncbi:MAG: diaminopimelate decarboxylase [Candidatus Woesearchaeota archaeon]